jgi:nitronate monooxygenase
MARAALDAGADVLVAQGAEAGGHGSNRGTLALVPAVVDLAGSRVPVVAAGGIAVRARSRRRPDARRGWGVRRHALLCDAGSLGRDRSQAQDRGGEWRRQPAQHRVRHLARERVARAGSPGRCLYNDHLRRWAGRELELTARRPSEGSRYAAARTGGDFDVAAVIAGESSGLIRDVPSAANVVHAMVRDAATLLARGAATLAA